MNTDFFEKIYNHPSLKKENYDEIINAHTYIEFSKNDILLNQGKTSNEYILIERGLFRSYVFDFKGDEVTTDFFGSNEILISVGSLFLRTPSKEILEALTDGVGYKIEFEVFQKLFNSIEGFTEWGRTWMSNQLFISKQRSIDILTLSATERYLNLVSEQPQIIQEVPLKFIASYLGITDTSLSRIRKEISQKKN